MLLTQDNEDPINRTEIVNAYEGYINEADQLVWKIANDIKVSFKFLATRYVTWSRRGAKIPNHPKCEYECDTYAETNINETRTDTVREGEYTRHSGGKFTITHEVANIEMTKYVGLSYPPVDKKWKEVDSELIHDICYKEFLSECGLLGYDQIFIHNIFNRIHQI